jgi:hypothetical protein
MGKLIIWASAVLTATFIIAAACGVFYNSHVRTEHMPADIQYEVVVDENIWPDRFYTDDSLSKQYQRLQADTYWTFEYGTYPLAGPVWVFHTFAIEITDAKFTTHRITR